MSLPSAELLLRVTSEGEYNHPVLLSLRLDNLGGDAIFLTKDGSLAGEISDPWHGDALLIRGVMPIGRIRQILFASEEHRMHVLQADHGNVPRQMIEHSTVDSTAFTGPALDFDLVQALEAHQLDKSTIGLEAAAYGRAEKIAGGLALAATPLAARPELSFSAIVQSLNLLAGHGLESETQISLVVASLLSQEVPETVVRSSNQALLTAAAEYALQSHLGISSRDLVSRAYAEAVALSGDSGSLKEQLRSALRVLSDEITDTEFEQSWPRKQFPVSSAVVQFVLRGDTPPTRRQLLNDSTGPSDVLSWFLTGLYLGRSRLPPDAYPDPGLLDAIERATMRYMNRVADGLVESAPIKFDLVRTFGLESVYCDGVEIAQFAYRHIFEQLIEYFRSQPKEQIDEQAALQFCVTMGWTACVQTVIHGLLSEQKDDLKLETAGRDRRLTISFHGFTTDISQKLKVGEFRKRIAGSFETIPPDGVGSDLNGLFRKISESR
jgi:hypothetical protein